MRSIWKFPLGDMENAVKMPKGATVLCVQMQDLSPALWAEVDTNKNLETRVFRLYGTGFELRRQMGHDDRYIGTVQQGPYVWHVYEDTGI